MTAEDSAHGAGLDKRALGLVDQEEHGAARRGVAWRREKDGMWAALCLEEALGRALQRSRAPVTDLSSSVSTRRPAEMAVTVSNSLITLNTIRLV